MRPTIDSGNQFHFTQESNLPMKRVFLINPKTVNNYYHVSQSRIDRLLSRFFSWSYDRRFDIPTHSHCTTMPPISLYSLEALIQGGCDVEIVDKQVDGIDFDADVDLVCLTAPPPRYPELGRFHSGSAPAESRPPLGVLTPPVGRMNVPITSLLFVLVRPKGI